MLRSEGNLVLTDENRGEVEFAPVVKSFPDKDWTAKSLSCLGVEE